jgi:hypothetical protein
LLSLGSADADGDISGDWSLTLRPDQPPPAFSFVCHSSIRQVDTNVLAAIACEDAGTGLLSGTYDDAMQSFQLSGEMSFLGSHLMDLSMIGEKDDGLLAVSGQWTGVLNVVTYSGTFTGQQGHSFSDGLWGNANCADLSNSVDALLSLQREARLLPFTPRCWVYADVNLNGDLDSLDADLILQHEGGLIDVLPIFPGS